MHANLPCSKKSNDFNSRGLHYKPNTWIVPKYMDSTELIYRRTPTTSKIPDKQKVLGTTMQVCMHKRRFKKIAMICN